MKSTFGNPRIIFLLLFILLFISTNVYSVRAEGTPSFESYSEASSSGNVGSLDVPMPSGTTQGDLLVAVFTHDSSTGTLSSPSDWTDLFSTLNTGGSTLLVSYKIAEAGESGPYTFSSTDTDQLACGIARFSGVDTSNPINAQSSTNTGSSNSPECLACTTTVDNTLVLRIMGANDDDYTSGANYPSGHTGAFTVQSTGRWGETHCALAYVEQPSAGSTGTASFTMTASEQWGTIIIAIAPSGYNLNLRVMDWDLTDSISGAKVYKDSDIKTSDADGWANWTQQTGTVQIKVKYYGYWVNGSFSVTMDSDKTINVRCKLYDVVVTVQETLQNAILVPANVSVFNGSSTQANHIATGLTNSSGQLTFSNLPNNTLTFTLYAGSDYTLKIGNSTQLVSSEGQSITRTADENYISTSHGYNLIIFVGFVLPYFFKRHIKKMLGLKTKPKTETIQAQTL